MKKGPTTAERILEASRLLFNEKGYAATRLTEIAEAVGISQGNLTYHFPTKRELANRLQEQARSHMRARRTQPNEATPVDEYISRLLFAMELTWQHRFLLRDRAQFDTDQQLFEDLEAIQALLARMQAEDYFRRDLPVDVSTLSRSLWIITRYWMDHLRELEGRVEVSRADQERGLQHHLALLLPYLTVAARRLFENAVARLDEARAEPGPSASD